jgi:hypothetical protein
MMTIAAIISLCLNGALLTYVAREAFGTGRLEASNGRSLSLPESAFIFALFGSSLVVAIAYLFGART